MTVLTVVVGGRVTEAVVVLLGDALAVTGDEEFCVVVVIALVLALSDALP